MAVYRVGLIHTFIGFSIWGIVKGAYCVGLI